MRVSPTPLLAVLALLQVVLSALVLRAGVPAGVTYVFTPMVDVVPGGAPLSAGEAAAVANDLRTQVDARDIQQAYARMGSTMSLDDLLRGVEGLPDAGVPLSAGQAQAVGDLLRQARTDHDAMRSVQAEILDLERDLDARVVRIRALRGGAGAVGAVPQPGAEGTPPPLAPGGPR
jgi:hypothetical protein